MQDSENPFVDTSVAVPTFAIGNREHPSVYFLRKPLPAETVDALLVQSENMSSEKLLEFMRKKVCELVISWKFRADGALTDVRPNDVNRLKHNLLIKIYTRAITSVQTDPIPADWGSPDPEDEQAGK